MLFRRIAFVLLACSAAFILSTQLGAGTGRAGIVVPRDTGGASGVPGCAPVCVAGWPAESGGRKGCAGRAIRAGALCQGGERGAARHDRPHLRCLRQRRVALTVAAPTSAAAARTVG